MFTPDGEIILDLDYIKSDMRRAIKAIKRNSFYAQKIREYIKDLDRDGVKAIEPLQTKLKSFFGASELGVRDCCKRWVELLQMIKNFGGITKKEPEPMGEENDL